MAAPMFDASTIAALTQRIQGDITSGADPRKKSPKAKKTAAKSSATTSSEHLQTVPESQLKLDSGRKRKRAAPEKSAPNEKSQNNVVARRPIKKSRAGIEDKAPSKGRRGSVSSGIGGIKKTNDSREKAAKNELNLKDFVAELGGDDDDLKLIEEANSDSEVEGHGEDEQTASLRKDLQSFISSLGFTKAQPDAADTSDEDESIAKNDVNNSNSDGADSEGEEAQSNIDGARAASSEPKIISQVKQALEGLTERKKPHPFGLIVEPQSEWHSMNLPEIVRSGSKATSLTADVIEQLHYHARDLLDAENEKYSSAMQKSSSSNQFYATIMSSGTLSDKISALTLSVQESPLHKEKTLDSLMNLAKKRNRGQAVEVLSALKDLLGPGSLLPSSRRLRAFGSQPAFKFVDAKAANSWRAGQRLPEPLTNTHLVVWAYEDWLKSTYFEVLKILETWLSDEIPYTRGKALDFVFALLRDKPEQEANLLRLLVNKLGDTDKKIASKASYDILQVENAHPAMKPLIISSLENDLIFRLRQSNTAKYYAIITLNQTVLSTKEESVARQLLDIYFALFIDLLNKPKPASEIESKVPSINSKGDTQGGGSAPGKKARKKAAAQARSAASEDELREKMLSGVLTGVNRAMPYVDKTSDFFDKHLDTLFRVTHSANFNTSIQALMLLQQLSGTQQAASDRFYRVLYESLLDTRLYSSSKQALYLNLLFRSLRADLSVKRVKAFVKRLLQVTAMQQPSFACAAIYLAKELEAVFPSLSSLVDHPEVDASDDEEIYHDADKIDEDTQAAAMANSTAVAPNRQSYDGRKRDPEFARAELSSLWELAPLQQHFHPSVSLFADHLSQHQTMPSKPDLNVNTLIHFLDRFVYRNPKKTAAGLRGHSLMQPLVGSGDASGLLVSSADRKHSTAPLNSQGFKNKKEDAVGADEVFFHKYFSEIGKKADKQKKKAEAKKRSKDAEESGDEEEDEDEDEIWQALVDSRPEIEGEEDDAADWDDMDGFEEAMQEDEDVAESESVGSDGRSLSDSGAEGAFDFDDDGDDLLGSDDELPEGVTLPADESEAEEEEQATTATESQNQTQKKKRKAERRKMLKSLPMFASADDYASMLDAEDEDY